MDDTVQYRVCDCGLPYDLVPGGHGELGGQNGGPGAAPVIYDLKELAPLGLGEARQTKVIDEQEVRPGEL